MPGSSSAQTASAPIITMQPANQTVSAGQSASFQVTATGTAPLSYQWSRNGTLISGATSGTYTTAATTSADSGESFSVRVTNSAGAVTSNAAVLTVVAALSVTSATLPAATVGSAYSASLQATGGTPPYTWTLRSGQLPTGLTLSSAGLLSGTPTTAATATFDVTVTDARGTQAPGSLTLTIAAAAATSPFGHVVIVVEENADYATIVGNTAQMPYLNSLIAAYGLPTQYYANAHPSISDYFMLVTGQILTSDDTQTPASFPVSVDNIARELSAQGKTWKAYAEDLPYVGYIGGDTGNYAVRHVPFAYLTDVQDSPSGLARLVPFTQFATDLASGQLPQFSFITPNLCNDAHNCALSVADAWLQTNIAPLLSNAAFRSDGLLIVTFDESADDDTNGGGRIATALVSPAYSRSGYQSATLYQHQSSLRLMLQGLGVNTVPGSGASAPTMWDFFTFPAPQ